MKQINKTPLKHILGYSLGDGAFSMTMNTIWAFGMFFYTQALGIDAAKTALILAIPLVWDAITDPVMGYISDNTRSRFGRRHPHILIGGVLMAIFYFLLWYVPGFFQSSEKLMILYLIIISFISRTLMTWYYVPYIALGFEISTDYNEKSKLQSTRYLANMAFNLIFCGIIAWRVFLVDAEGNRDTTIQSNYTHMGFTFGLVILVLILITVFSTRKYSSDTRKEFTNAGQGLKGFFGDMLDIFKDNNASLVYLFFCVVNISFVFVMSMQMYVYVSFMDLSSMEASVVHSSGMILFAFGSLISAPIAKRFDKKQALYTGVAINIGANVCLGLVFLTGLLKPHMIPFWKTSVAAVVFCIFQASYWLGSGFLYPMVFSMVADVSEIKRLKTGKIKDGSYSAVLSFLTKLTSSVGLIVVGKMLTLTGFVEGQDVQSSEVALKLTKMMIYFGVVFTVLAVLFIIKYPVNRKYMKGIKKQYSE